MKKIITSLLFFWLLLAGGIVQSANLYLIDNGNTTGANKVWTTTTVSGFTVYHVNLSQSGTNGSTMVTLTTWLTDRILASPTFLINGVAGSKLAVGDQVWIAGGTYNVSTPYAYTANFTVYGGFAGTETAIGERAKGSNVWDYTNETIINGSGYTSGTAAIFTATGDRANVLLDGMTFTACPTVFAVWVRAATIQYCKFTNNTFNALNLTTAAAGSAICNGCYFYNNSGNGGPNATCINSNQTLGTATISNCIFENNSNASTITSSTGIKAYGTGTTSISNCIFKNNTSSSTGSAASSSVMFYTGGQSISNCLIYNCTGKPALYIGNTNGGGNVYNCTFANSDGPSLGANGTGSSVVANTVFWGTTSTASTLTITASSTTSLKNCAYNTLSGTPTSNVSPVVLPLTNTGAGAPYFVDPTNNIWSLQSGSSLLNQGTSTGAPTTDINGISRSSNGVAYDIGAYESIESSTNVSSLSLKPWSDISIVNNGSLTIDASAKLNSIFAGPGSQISISAGKVLTTEILTLQNSSSGTATFLNNGTLTATTVTAKQELPVARNWYMSSPVSGAAGLPTANTGTLTVYAYPENDELQATGGNGYAAGGVWNTVTSGTIDTGKGYIVKNSAANATVSFTGTSFNTGDKEITGLTYTAANPKHGFQLMGNPYPSYLNVLPSINANANLETTVWYRTRDTNETPAYHFETVNTATGVGTNASGTGRVTGYIPPMQSFWVRTTANNQSITLYNTNRSHATSVTMTGFGSVPTTSLKAPKAEQQQFSLLGLYVSNGTTGDETILMFAPEASNGQDTYDSKKLSNNNPSIPEIYTTIASNQIAINGMNRIPETEMPIGFTTGRAGEFSIKTSEISNFDKNVRVFLRDKHVNTEIELTPTSEYNFTSSETINNEDRFSLIFRSSGVSTNNVGNLVDSVSIYTNKHGQIVILSNETCKYAVYSFDGRIILSGISTDKSISTSNLSKGVYIVKVNNVTEKVIIN